MTSTNSVLTPSTPDEVVAALAADPDVVVIGGGTLVVPQVSLGTPVERAVWLGRAALDSVDESGDEIIVGATASLAACSRLPAPLGPCAANVGDPEVRSQATIGGNICAPVPYGDLRGPLLALDASIRCATADGERTVDAATFFALSGPRIALDVRFASPAAGSFVPLQRPHTVSLTAIGISAVRGASGEVRLAATGVAPEARRLYAAEAALAGGSDPVAAADAAREDIEPYDDVLASAAHRARVIPTLVRRAIDQLGG